MQEVVAIKTRHRLDLANDCNPMLAKVEKMTTRRNVLGLLLGAPLAVTRSRSVHGAGPAVHTVSIESFEFVPKIVQARPGDRVMFVNRDIVPHTATGRPRKWDSGELGQGESWTHEVSEIGTYSFYCRFHPTMKGSIVIR